MARPTKFRPEAVDEFLKNLRLGLPRKDAAALAGWGESTVKDYIDEGRALLAQGKVSQAKAEFVAKVDLAEAHFVRAISAVIVNAANGAPAVYDDQGRIIRAERAPDWKAAAFLGERRYPKVFGQRQAVEIAGAGGGPIEVEVASVERLVAKVHALRPVPDPLELPPSRNGHGGHA